MSLPNRILPGLVRRYLGRLRFPTLFALTAAVFIVNVLVPDPIPFVDEVLLALVGLLLGSLRERRGDDDPNATAGDDGRAASDDGRAAGGDGRAGDDDGRAGDDDGRASEEPGDRGGRGAPRGP